MCICLKTEVYPEQENFLYYDFNCCTISAADINVIFYHSDKSITQIANADGTLKQELSYDAWGRLRDPATHVAYAPGTEPALFLGRGFTGHEYLPWFGLINMNARLYDPALGRFLSPDPYVQVPDFTQSFNRYSYCINNPLIYSDPTGEKWWHWLVGDILTGGFFSIAASSNISINITNSFVNSIGLCYINSFFSNDRANNTWHIFNGLFKTDKNLSISGRIKQFISRFTWESPQSQLGYSISQTHNLFGGVENVDYYGGTTVLKSFSKEWGAFTVGSFIIGDNGIEASATNELFQHEYGHYLQSQDYGPDYLFKVAIPSLIDAGLHDQDVHEKAWFEQDANARALSYWKLNILGFDENKDWKNPKGKFASGIHTRHWYDYTSFNMMIGNVLFNIEW